MAEKVVCKVKEILNSCLDWNYIIKKALENSVFPQFYRNLITLSASDESLIPQSVLKQIREMYYSFISCNMILYDEAKRILRVLKTKGIEFMPMKGVLLAETIYPDRDLRAVGDIDLLFPNIEEKKRAERQLTRLGYTFQGSLPTESWFYKYKHGMQISCEPHLFIGWSSYFQYPKVDDIWKTSLKKTIEGVKVSVMTPEYMFRMLCLHSVKEGIFSLKDLCDAIEILRKFPELDWKFIVGYNNKDVWIDVLTIPLYIISTVSNDLFAESIVPERILEQINKGGFIKSSINQKSVKQLINDDNFQFPILYESFCRNCDKCTFCPLILSQFIPSESLNLSKEILQGFQRFFWSYYLILRFVRKSYGIVYAIRCFCEQSRYILVLVPRTLRRVIKCLKKSSRS